MKIQIVKKAGKPMIAPCGIGVDSDLLNKR
jgi:hypothetical protein